LAKVCFEHADIGDRQAMAKILQRYPIEAVVHFAANAYVAESQENPFKYFKNNIVNSMRLFEALEERGIRKLIFSSSCATYGSPQYLPLDENHPQRPESVYGFTKLIIERTLRLLRKEFGWSYLILRYANAAGADLNVEIGESHDPEPHLIPRILKIAQSGHGYLEINGDDYETRDGTCVRDYIHVSDLARAHIQALNLIRKEDIGEAINLGTESGASIKEIVDLCSEITGVNIEKRFLPRRIGDPSAFVANCNKAYEILGWRQELNLKETISSAWNWEQDKKF
jgi:UDP-glucose 4-epimerase